MSSKELNRTKPSTVVIVLRFLVAALIVQLATTGWQAYANKSEVLKADVQVKRFPVMVVKGETRFEENIYVVFDHHSKDAAIIDPGNRSQMMEAFIARQKLLIKAVVNTHGHYDHIAANHFYAEKYKVDVYGHTADLELYVDEYTEQRPTKFMDQLTTLPLGSLAFKIISTPGHSKGSLCLAINDVLLSGDTLFKGSIGRTWGKDNAARERKMLQIINNIKIKLLPLDDKTRVFPGHGAETTIGKERRHNPFLSFSSLPGSSAHTMHV